MLSHTASSVRSAANSRVSGRSAQILSKPGFRWSSVAVSHAQPGSRGTRVLARAEPQMDIRAISDIISSQQPLEAEKQFSIERLANTLGVPIATVKNMAFKRRGLLSMTPEEVQSKIQKIAEVVEVPEETARQMVVIQPGLLFETDKQAETLKYGIRSICYELNASKEEVVKLIMENQSVLHGRELRLSVADVAHLAMLREPKGRIVD